MGKNKALKKIYRSRVLIYSLIFSFILLITTEAAPDKVDLNSKKDSNEESNNEFKPVVKVKGGSAEIPAGQKERFEKLIEEGKKLFQEEMDYEGAIKRFKEAESLAITRVQKADVYFYLSLAYYATLEERGAEEFDDTVRKLIETDYYRKLDRLLCPPRYIKLFQEIKKEYGVLKVQSKPPGADVYLNDSRIPAGKTPLTIGSKAGSVKIRVKKGKKAKKEILRVIAGKETTSSLFILKGGAALIYVLGGLALAGGAGAAFLLKSKPGEEGETPGPATGSIQVNSSPTGARVYLDGSDTGQTTNCTLTNVSPGSHTVNLIKEGYEDYEESVSVTAGQTITVNAPLTMHTITLTNPTSGAIWTKGEELEIGWTTSGSASFQGNVNTSARLNPLSNPGANVLSSFRRRAFRYNRFFRNLIRTRRQLESTDSFINKEVISDKSSKFQDVSKKFSSSAKDVNIFHKKAKNTGIIKENPNFGSINLPVVGGTSFNSPKHSPAVSEQLGNMRVLTLSDVNIELYKGDIQVLTISSSTENDGSYTWIVDPSLDDGSDYKVRVACVSDSGIYGESSNFEIKTLDFVTDLDEVTVPEGGTAAFQVKLSAQPSSDVSVTVGNIGGDSDISVQSGSSLTFTPSDWDSYQEVMLAAAEDTDTSNGQATIRVSASGLPDKDITATEQDNDTLSFVTDLDEVTVPEGSTAPFQVKLSAQPSSDVSVTVGNVGGDSDISVQTGSNLTFTTANWNDYQEVMLEAAEDADTSNGQGTIRVSASGLPDKDITATEQDNDTLSFVTDLDEVTVPEGGTAPFQVKLSAQPLSDVSVTVGNVGGDSDISVQSGSSLTFTTTNWNDYQEVMLAASEDTDTSNGQATIRVSASGLPDKDITATEQDNDINAPSDLTAVGGSTDESSFHCDLSWTDNSNNETGFEIEMSLDAPGYWSRVSIVAANVTTYRHTGLESFKQYWYRVRAFNDLVESSYSNEADTMTPEPTPNAPTNLMANAVSEWQIDLSWTDNSNIEWRFLIERKEGESGSWSQIGQSADPYFQDVEELLPNTNYYYRVRAQSFDFIYSSYSNEASATTPEAKSITITEPTGSSIWTKGYSADITWTSTGWVNDVKIDLYKGSTLQETIVASTEDDGTYTWSTVNPSLTDGSDYKVRISCVSASGIYDESDIFTVEEKSITVTEPISSTIWSQGYPADINWTSTGTISNVKIDLYKGSTLQETIVASTEDDGTYTWTQVNPSLVDGSDYKVRVSCVSYSGIYDESDAFTIEEKSITVTEPTSSTIWTTNFPADITWTSTGAVSTVKIDLYKGSTLQETIVASTENDGTYTWVTVNPSVEDGSDYKVRISDTSDSGVYSESEIFRIEEKSINVLEPTSSTFWTKSYSADITWTSLGTINNVKIDLYKGGSLQQTITSSTDNDGSYTWGEVTTSLPTGSDYKVRISSVSDSRFFGESDEFNITHSYVFTTKWGNEGTGDGQFNSPRGIAIDNSGYVYVADSYNHRIQKFTSSGSFVTKWGEYGSEDGQFNDPGGIAVDSSGYVYVADTGNHRIQKFDSNGTFITKWGSLGAELGLFNKPHGIAVDSSSYVYVAEILNDRIQKFTSDGTLVTKWGSEGSEDNQFRSPYDIAVDSSGYVYVADRTNKRIQKFDSNGTFITKWGGEYKYPQGIAVDGAGYVYMIEGDHMVYTQEVYKFISDGTFVTKWGGPGTGNGQFWNPFGIVVDSFGYVYVADTDNHRIQKFGPIFN